MTSLRRSRDLIARLPGRNGIAVFGLCLLALPASLTAAADERPVVNVTGGAIEGRDLPDGHGAVFKGVPFAAPPVGALRWREPMPVEPWKGMRDAGTSGPPAMQASFGWNSAMAAASREDCLYLDVWTPSTGAGKRPVMVWIHGGGNVGGAGGFDFLYDGTRLISHDVVLVVVEYRLGIFGFLAHPALTRESSHHASGNYGLLDQLAALRWVKDNIAEFGGDPGNVTVFGQSAGSTDILHLLASPLSRGLFQRAIAESGSLPPAGATPTLARAEQEGEGAVAKLGAPADDPLAFLRQVPASEVLAKADPVATPNVDDWVLTQSPVTTFADGHESPVPLIIGGCAIEFPLDGNADNWRKIVRRSFGDLAPDILSLYQIDGVRTGLPEDPVEGGTAAQIGTDFFRAGSIIEGEWHASSGHPTWEYQFDRAIPPRPHVGHSSDLPYVFGNLLEKGSQGGAFTDVDRQVSDLVQAYWTNFARNGDPNGPGLPPWPPFDAGKRRFAEFGPAGVLTIGDHQRGVFLPIYRRWLVNDVK
ncbi:MAG TPA: carboxylesterase family protein [Candidatus Didemnitutus sp.]